MKENKHFYIYRYRFSLGQFLNFLVGFGLIGCSVFLLMRFTVDNILITIASFFIVIGLIQIFLIANYLTKSLDLEIRIDCDKDLFEIQRKGKRQGFKLKDLASVEIIEQKSIGLYGFNFDFAKYNFVDGRCCIVTNMMTDGYYIPGGLQPSTRQVIFPFIWSATDV
jgi:hypothetical protein